MRTKILLASLALSIGTLSAQNYQVPVSEKNEPMMKGKFQPTWSSLENYQVPEWFRNAKFGIWAHWGATVCRRFRRLDGTFHVSGRISGI